MDSNPICQPSPTNKMKCSFLEYVQLLMISLAGQWTRTPSASPLQPKKWNATFWITFNFWWLAGLVNGLKPHPPPLSSQRNEMLIFVLCSTSNDQQGLSMDLNPIHHLSPAKKWNAHILIMFNFWWLAGLVNGLKPHPPLLSSWKHEMLVFVLHSTSDDLPGCSMDSNPICHPLPPKKWNAHFWITFNFWWLAGWLMDSNPIHHPSSVKKWNPHFWIMFNFWLMARLVDGLKPHPPPLSSQRNEMLIFVLCSTSNDQPGLSMDLNPIHHLSPAKKWNAHILIMFNFWWLAGLVNGLKPHPPPLSSQKKWNACF